MIHLRSPTAEAVAATATQAKKKLSYKDQRELEGMEANIQKAEAHLARLTEQVSAPETVSDKNQMQQISQELAAAQAEVDRLYARWSQLTQQV